MDNTKTKQAVIALVAARINAQQAVVAALLTKQALECMDVAEVEAAQTRFTGRTYKAELTERLWFEFEENGTDGVRYTAWATEWREGGELVRVEPGGAILY